jgi:hypothetical protein
MPPYASTFDKGHLWYFPPPERFQQLADYANEFGAPAGRLYFSRNGQRPSSLAATRLGRKAYSAELDPTYFTLGVARFMEERSAAVAATGG